MFKQLILLICVLLMLGCAGVKAPALSHTFAPECEIYSLKSAQCIDESTLVNTLSAYPVIFIGDHHTQAHWHERVAQIITELSHAGFKVWLANEWFYPQDNPSLKRFVDQEDNESVFLEQIAWKTRMKSYPYVSFKPMYDAVRQNNGGLFGINLSSQERLMISDANASAMGKNEYRFFSGLDLNTAAHQQMLHPFLSHCHAPKKDETDSQCMERMYRVQVAWDTKMALESFRLAQQLKPNEKLIVFAGSMHMQYNLGIPLRFARLSPVPSITLLPLPINTTQTEHGIADILIRYSPSTPETMAQMRTPSLKN